MAKAKIKFHKKGWDKIVTQVIDNEGVPRMKRVADACNTGLDSGREGYKVSTEGDDPLEKRDYRATVITTSAEAIIDNAKHNTLIQNFHLAGGD